MPKIFVAGHNGMVGSAICRQLAAVDACEIVTADRRHLDLRDKPAVHAFIQDHQVDQIYLAAAKVGGIYANNTYPAEFIHENLEIQGNVINAAWAAGVEKLLFLGSSCIYPKLAPQPMSEEALLTGTLEPTNEPYAIAKIAGIKMCESYNRQYGTDFRSVMPTNLYGPGDNYHPENSHVIPGLMRRIHEAKQNKRRSVAVWGTGAVKREFLYVDDMARASVFIMNIDKKTFWNRVDEQQSHINVGFGTDITIRDLAHCIAKVVEFQGELIFDSSKPDGAPQKLMDVSKLSSMGWEPKMDLMQGLQNTYKNFLEAESA